MNARIKQITDSLQEMKGLLHRWDDVQDEIDATLEKVDTDPPTPEKMQELRRLVQGAISENIENLETGETLLKATAIGGLAIPTAYFAPHVFTYLVAAGWPTWMALASLPVGGAIANGFLGSAGNALGQGLAAPYHWFATGRFPNVVDDWWEMSAAHFKAGAVAGGIGTVAGFFGGGG